MATHNLTAGALFRVTLFFRWLRMCQDQATCAQPEALGRINRHSATKKSLILVLIYIYKSECLCVCVCVCVFPIGRKVRKFT